MDPDRIPTLPAPPHLSSVRALRDAATPAALDELRAELRAELARVSAADLSQEARLADHETRMRAIEKASVSAATDTAALVGALTGKIPPKILGALVALGTLATTALEVWRTMHGGHP